ncbi:MAG: hypothetical protein ACI9TH_000360 [Kiritimatiellia bacterium]|jgi:hypothetical protein
MRTEIDQEGRSTGQRWLIRGLFIAIWPAFIVQYIYYHKGFEPYPAVLMPSFGGPDVASRERASTEQIEIRIILADGAVVTCSMDDLLEDAPSAYRRNIMKTSLSSPPRSWIRPAYVEGLHAWLRDHCAAIAKSDPVAMEVVYTRFTHDLTRRPVEVIDQTVLDRHRIDFK